MGHLAAFFLVVVVALSGTFAGAKSSTASSPTPRPVEEISLEELLAHEIRGGEAGSYALRLAEFKAQVELHGYLTTEWKRPEPGVATFDLHHATILARARVTDRVLPELALEWEHGGADFYLPYAHVDLVASPLLIGRIGFFPIPIGAFNEYQYPDFLRKTAQQPLTMREIVPGLWSDVGLQVRGKWVSARGREINWAAYVVNGLEQADPVLTDAVVPDGGAIRDMRPGRGTRMDLRQRSRGDPAGGARLGAAPFQGLELGISGYRGDYTSDGRRPLTITDADATLRAGRLLVRLEMAVAIQARAAGSRLWKQGTCALVAVRALRWAEPYVLAERLDVAAGPAGRRRNFLVGSVLYPFPDTAPSVMAKLEWSVTIDGSGARSRMAMAQFATGF